MPPEIIYARWLAYGAPIQTPVLERTANGARIFSSYVSAHHFERLCTKLQLSQQQWLLVTFLYADATVLVKRGTRSAHPVYMVYANPNAAVPKSQLWLLVGYMPVVSKEYMDDEGIAGPVSQATFRAQIWQKSIEIITRRMGVTQHTRNGIYITPLGHNEPVHFIPILGAFLGDRPELMMAVGMYTSQNASQMARPCRTCNIAGPELLQPVHRHHPVGRPDDMDVVARCSAIIDDRTPGQVTHAREVLRAHSRQAVKPAVSDCYFFSLETSTPRCTLHTTKIVMSTYLLTWTWKSFLAQDPSEQWLNTINSRARRIDPTLGPIYHKGKGGWGIHPSIMTGQHRQRALDVLVFAARGVAVADYKNDLTVRALATWRHLYVSLTLKRLTAVNLNEIDRCVGYLKGQSLQAFGAQTTFAFPTGHELEHIRLDREEYGNFTVTNTEQGEKGHKTMVKEYWSQTSRQKTERTMVKTMEFYVQGHILRPLSAAVDESPKTKRVGLVGNGTTMEMGKLIDEYEHHRDPGMQSIPWHRLLAAWAQECSDPDQYNTSTPDSMMHQNMRIHQQYRFSQGEKVKATPRFHRTKYLTDVVKLADNSYRRVVLIFGATNRALTADGYAAAYFYVQHMRYVEHCTVYMLELVQETDVYSIIKPSEVQKLYATRWVQGEDGAAQYYLLDTDVDKNIRAAH